MGWLEGPIASRLAPTMDLHVHKPLVGASLLAIRWRSQRPCPSYLGINAPGT
jgi:hypothetical protein